jgi:hypothetical protein
MVVFCITCKNRTPHLRQTLPINLEHNPDSRFVVLDYNSQDDLLPFLRSLSRELDEERLAVYSYRGHPKFRMAHAKNLAHRLGILEGGDILVNLDADNFAGAGFDRYASERLQELNAFLFATMIKGSMTRGVGGRIAVNSKTFLLAGGYDEAKFEHWGSDDKDFNIRLKMMGVAPLDIDRQFLSSVTHNDKVRFKDYPHMHEKEEDYFKVYPSMIDRAVVNEGRVGCGTVFKNFERDDIVEVKPVPTRIFGIGYPKTGTNTLHQALKLLGLDSWHWSSAHVAKAIWREMNSDDRSESLERYEALCDLPIPLLYKKLDVAYPGSKFILTVRKEGKWLNSVRRHFMPEHNPWRYNWDNDPFSHRVHHLAYGRCDFDAETFLARYRQHNAEVQEYFKWRPQDLLLLNLDNGDGWDKLCRFLGKEAPSYPFPHENKS